MLIIILDIMFPNIYVTIVSYGITILIAIITASLYLNYKGILWLCIFLAFMIYITYVYFTSLREITRIGKSFYFNNFENRYRRAPFLTIFNKFFVVLALLRIA
jgi:hypothetical protein